MTDKAAIERIDEALARIRFDRLYDAYTALCEAELATPFPAVPEEYYSIIGLAAK